MDYLCNGCILYTSVSIFLPQAFCNLQQSKQNFSNEKDTAAGVLIASQIYSAFGIGQTSTSLSSNTALQKEWMLAPLCQLSYNSMLQIKC